MNHDISVFFTRTVLAGFFIVLSVSAESQSGIEMHQVEITCNKTSSLIFPSVIKSVDKGSRDILAQKAKGVENVLQLKAARENFPETNVTVITSDGTLHQFSVNYSKQPISLSLDLAEKKGDTISASALIFQSEMTETEMDNYAGKIIETKKSLKTHRERKHGIGISLRNIYIRDNVMFFHFHLKNQSNINYDVDFLRLYVRDNVKVKRTASQEVDMNPMYVHGNDRAISGQSEQDIVYALEKFTIPDAKQLVIEMFEKNGGRNLNLQIKNKTIVKAKRIE